MQIGRHSPKLVQLRKALRKGDVTEDGLLPIEGPILLEEASRGGIEIVDLFVRAGAHRPEVSAERMHEVPADVFKTIQDTEQSQGVIATVRPRQFDLEDVLQGDTPLIVVLGRLQDPGNVGTILRIGEAFGATGCVALPETVSFYNGKALRASAGSVFRLPHLGGVALPDLTHALKARDIRIVGTALTSQSSVERWDWRKPAAVLIGNEGSGLNREELQCCDSVLRIPHKSSVESLNSAIATAVILYEASRQRR